jgi:hypothetical protein
MTVNRLLYIADDGTVSLNDVSLIGIDRKYFDWIPSNIHAIQWYGDEIGGDIEFKPSTPLGGDKPNNERFSELGEWTKLVDIFNEEVVRREEAERVRLELIEASKDYWQILRDIRDYKLLQCDWTQLPNAPLSEEKKQKWEVYRQQLRDLANNIADPKPLVNAYETGEVHPDWPVPPQ